MADETNKKPYRAVIVALDKESGIFFAKRSDSRLETDHIIFDDILRIMDDFDTAVTLKNKRDGYGDWVLTMKPETEDYSTITYKVCFDDDDE